MHASTITMDHASFTKRATATVAQTVFTHTMTSSQQLLPLSSQVPRAQPQRRRRKGRPMKMLEKAARETR